MYVGHFNLKGCFILVEDQAKRIIKRNPLASVYVIGNIVGNLGIGKVNATVIVYKGNGVSLAQNRASSLDADADSAVPHISLSAAGNGKDGGTRRYACREKKIIVLEIADFPHFPDIAVEPERIACADIARAADVRSAEKPRLGHIRAFPQDDGVVRRRIILAGAAVGVACKRACDVNRIV